jgi:hypothetical protein
VASAREDPRGVAEQMLEDADEVLRSLRALQQEVRAFLADAAASGACPLAPRSLWGGRG